MIVTEPGATLQAVAVAERLAEALGAEVNVLAVQHLLPLPRDGEVLTTGDAETLMLRMRASARVRFRVIVAANVTEGLQRALPPSSLVVVGGRRQWWPNTASRLCRTLEALGHYVLFVDEAHHAA